MFFSVCILVVTCLSLLSCDLDDPDGDSSICRTYATEFNLRNDHLSCLWDLELLRYSCEGEYGYKIEAYYDSELSFIMEFSEVGLYTRSSYILTIAEGKVSESTYAYDNDGKLNSIYSENDELGRYSVIEYIAHDEKNRPVLGTSTNSQLSDDCKLNNVEFIYNDSGYIRDQYNENLTCRSFTSTYLFDSDGKEEKILTEDHLQGTTEELVFEYIDVASVCTEVN